MPPEGDVARINVRLTPRGGRDVIERRVSGDLHVRVAAPAVDGRANEALLRLLARALGVPRSSLAITGGQRSRSKLVSVVGFSQHEVELRLDALEMRR
jgi:uncharacterized protein YggU (UPF0235/DUF167 family)